MTVETKVRVEKCANAAQNDKLRVAVAGKGMTVAERWHGVEGIGEKDEDEES